MVIVGVSAGVRFRIRWQSRTSVKGGGAVKIRDHTAAKTEIRIRMAFSVKSNIRVHPHASVTTRMLLRVRRGMASYFRIETQSLSLLLVPRRRRVGVLDTGRARMGRGMLRCV